MPYIKNEARIRIEEGGLPATPGEVNFLVTALLDECIKVWGLSYGTINSLVGALECSKLELYRRIAAPYEDVKVKENGDVFSKENLTV